MKNLLWCAAKRYLPTMTQLQSKRVNVNPICPVCSMAPETIGHSLLSCPVAAVVWDQGDGVEQWCVPSSNNIKVNVDAVVFDDNSTFCVGFVARDSNDFFVEGGTKLFHGSISLVVVEAIGVREALSWIKDHSWLSVDLETDCLSVVQAIRSSVVMLSLFGQVVSDCKDLLSTLRNVSVYFVKR
uniref:RNase H type-1 domain-containing protein n=1 Tax=Cannabis sativa TaxID=3483 RepID=A0A803PAP9_CANSA